MVARQLPQKNKLTTVLYVEKGMLKDKAYAIIKDKIINCEYLPGEVLSESRLLEEIKSSRTPIREALNKLEQEKLVCIMPKRGILVNEVTVEMSTASMRKDAWWSITAARFQDRCFFK